MIRILISFLLYVVVGNVLSQENVSGRIIVSGEVKDLKGVPVSYAHILIKARNEGGVGDYYGRFNIPAFPGDTLTISAISYHNVHVVVPFRFLLMRYPISITMISDTVALKEVVIYPWPATLEQLKDEVLKMEVRDPVSENITPFLPTPKELKALASKSCFSMPGPFSLLYDRYSKEARQKKAYSEAIRKENAAKKFTPAMVARVTGLRSEREILNFIEFCAFENGYILEVTEYELYAAILKCYDDYCNSDPDTLRR